MHYFIKKSQLFGHAWFSCQAALNPRGAGSVAAEYCRILQEVSAAPIPPEALTQSLLSSIRAVGK